MSLLPGVKRQRHPTKAKGDRGWGQAVTLSQPALQPFCLPASHRPAKFPLLLLMGGRWQQVPSHPGQRVPQETPVMALGSAGGVLCTRARVRGTPSIAWVCLSLCPHSSSSLRACGFNPGALWQWLVLCWGLVCLQLNTAMGRPRGWESPGDAVPFGVSQEQALHRVRTSWGHPGGCDGSLNPG